MNRTAITILLITILFVVNNVSLFAQENSTAHSLRDSTFLLRSKKGVLKKLGDAIWIDAPQFNMQNNSGVIKNESPFTTFKGKVINQI